MADFVGGGWEDGTEDQAVFSIVSTQGTASTAELVERRDDEKQWKDVDGDQTHPEGADLLSLSYAWRVLAGTHRPLPQTEGAVEEERGKKTESTIDREGGMVRGRICGQEAPDELLMAILRGEGCPATQQKGDSESDGESGNDTESESGSEDEEERRSDFGRMEGEESVEQRVELFKGEAGIRWAVAEGLLLPSQRIAVAIFDLLDGVETLRARERAKEMAQTVVKEGLDQQDTK